MLDLFTKELGKKTDKLITKKIEINDVLINDCNGREIIQIMNLSIENTYRTIDTYDIEEDFPDIDINKYIENYKKILIFIKDMFIKKYEDISIKDKEVFLSRLEDARNKFKIERSEIIDFLNIIFKKTNEHKNIKITHDDIIFFCVESENNKTDGLSFLKENLANK